MKRLFRFNGEGILGVRAYLSIALFVVVLLVSALESNAGCEDKRKVVDSNGTVGWYFGTSSDNASLWRNAPMSLAPSGLGTTCGTGFTGGGFYAITTTATGVMSGSTGWSNCGTANPLYTIYTSVPSGGCGYAPYCSYTRFTYYNASINPNTYDFDCDGVVDAQDTKPGNPMITGVDSDGDGIDNGMDPWPNDPTLPGTGAVWTKYQDWKRISDGYELIIWKDSEGHSFSTWDGPGNAPSITDPSLWRRYYDTSTTAVTYTDAVGTQGTTGKVEGAAASSTTSDSTGSGAVVDAIGAEKSALESKLSDIYARQGSVGSTEEGLLGDVKTKLDLIKTAIENQTPGSVDLTSTNAKLDTANTHLGVIETKVSSLPADIASSLIGEGSLSDPSSGDVSSTQDLSEVADDANTSRLDSEKSILSGFLDSWWASNPVKSVVDNTTLTASGSSSFTLDGGSLGTHNIDLASLGDGFSAVGVILVSLAGLAGVIVVLRN